MQQLGEGAYTLQSVFLLGIYTPFSPCSFWGFISSGMKGVRKAFRSLYSTVNDLCSTIESRSMATCTSLLSLVCTALGNLSL